MKNPMNFISYGLFVATTAFEGKHNGCITNTAIQVTTTPNQITVAINKQNYTNELVKKSKLLNISIISQKADFELFKHFGFQTGREVDKFNGYNDYKIASNGVSYITKGVNAVIVAKVVQEIELETHTIFVCAVEDSFVIDETPSATYEYYFSNIKPKPQVKKEKKTTWRCSICTYEVEAEDLPDDFICPLCKHPKSDFEKVTD
jgi:flavin reductase (DIM6/NTAB) family NADH-FMN oxidoreductase RutF